MNDLVHCMEFHSSTSRYPWFRLIVLSLVKNVLFLHVCFEHFAEEYVPKALWDYSQVFYSNVLQFWFCAIPGCFCYYGFAVWFQMKYHDISTTESVLHFVSVDIFAMLTWPCPGA